jgi:(1->4)-alpha-D-glucan 1-alpha-D-glucosylmutase
LAQRVSLLGALNSLSQITLKAAMPGVPDFYQGTEFWDLSLVDPDNRRPVDFAKRAAVLASMDNTDWDNLAQNWSNGHIKLAWTRHLLKLRTELADVFTHGDYQPLQISGPHTDHIIAFARRRGRDAAITAVVKSSAALSQGGRAWPRAEAFDGSLNLDGYSIEGVSGKEVRLSVLFRHLPAAVLKATYTSALKPARRRVRA